MNWREYDASLRQRGSLMVWFTDETIEAWRAEPRTTPGGQPWYSSLALLTALTLRAVFRLALRQTEGLIGLCGRPGVATPYSRNGLPPSPSSRKVSSMVNLGAAQAGKRRPRAARKGSSAAALAGEHGWRCMA